jgi:hypothetical protein
MEGGRMDPETLGSQRSLEEALDNVVVLGRLPLP